MVKLTKRKGFNFFRSYYDVYNELNDADKIKFMDALLDRQFLGVKPSSLTGMARFAYLSQTNSIDSQVKGYEDKTKTILTPCQGGIDDPKHGGDIPPTGQVEEKEKEKEKEEKKKANIYRSFVHLKISKDEVETLKKTYTQKQVDDILDSIENYKNNKNYKSLFLTAKKWLEKEYKETPQKQHGITWG